MERKLKQRSLNEFFQESKEIEKENLCKVCQHRSSSPSDIVSSNPYVKKRRSYLRDEGAQYTLDAGQKNIGAQLCNDCHMIYDHDSIADCNLHLEYHNRFVQRDWFRVKYSQIDNWRKQNFCVLVDGGYLFSINMGTKSSLKQRLEEIIFKCVNIELGFPSDLNTIWKDDTTQLWGFIASSSKLKFPFIGAIILVEELDEVFTYTGDSTNSNSKKSFRGRFIGVNRIWVHKSLRRTGVATKLLDEVRHNMRNGYILPRSCIAFSELTDDGLAFAKKFSANCQILMYSVIPSKK
uniref:N-acetyltransferase ESCO1 n=1 Tax=Syphacia muris TaxID=451379 RepID=A0A0N5ARF4_9BILA